MASRQPVNRRDLLIQWSYLLVGVFFTSVPFPLLFLPNNIAPGGIAGVATLINALTGLPVGLLSALLNAPLFLLSWKRLGRAFAIKSLVCMLGVSAVIDLMPYGGITDDPILASVFGGVMVGTGIGLVLRGGATTGGTDMAASLIHERFPFISVGMVLLSLDCIVILASGFVFGIQSALYALIAIFLTTQVMDRVVEGFDSAKAFFVFSGQTEAIAEAVFSRLARGATFLRAQGAFSRKAQDVLLCVVKRQQVPEFKQIVREVDPTAFVMVTDVHEALGEGFTRPQTDDTGKNPAEPPLSNNR